MNKQEQDAPPLTEEQLLQVLFSERARDILNTLMPKVAEKLTTEEDRKRILMNVCLLMKRKDLLLQDLARITRMDRGQLSRYLDNSKPLLAKHILTIARSLDVNPLTLVTVDLASVIDRAVGK